MNRRNTITMGVFRHLIWIAAPVAGLVLGVNVAAAQQPSAPAKLTAETCLGCHGVEGFTIPDDKGGTRNLHVDKDKFSKSVHGSRDCVDCHKQITEVPHQKLDRIRVDCVSCHRDQLEEAKDAKDAKKITTLSLVMDRIDEYLKSVHARPNAQDQSETNATCYNCHQAHYVYPPGSPQRAEWRQNLPNICGKCHEGQLAAYKTSVHGREVLEKNNPRAAVCSDCHSRHEVESASLDATRLDITQNCGGCHQANL